MTRVVTYVDGYNLYHGMRDAGYRRFLWLNVVELARSLLAPDQELVLTRYFTTIVTEPEEKRLRQQVFLDALATVPNLAFQKGHYIRTHITCRNCGTQTHAYHEKMTDVKIAVAMVADAHNDTFDTAILVTGDGDQVGTVEYIRESFEDKSVIVAFPPRRKSKELRGVASGTIDVGRNSLAKCQFPEVVVRSDGYELRRPPEWA
jgi:uncharacterized LabA/DUF88 family protein